MRPNWTSRLLPIVLALFCASCRAAPPPSTVTEDPRLGEARALFDERSYDRAEALAREILAEVEASAGPDSLEVTRVLDVLVESLSYAQKGHQPEVPQLAERVLRIKKNEGDSAVEVARSARNLAFLLHSTDPARARRLHGEVVTLRESALGPSDPKVALAYFDLGYFHQAQEEYPQSIRAYRKALSIQEEAKGADDPSAGRTIGYLARVYSQAGDHDEARALYERALGIWESAEGSHDFDLALSHDGLAITLEELGRYDEARSHYEEALAIRESAYGPDDRYVASSLANLAVLLRLTGDYTASREHYERALVIERAAYGDDHEQVAITRYNLGVLAFYMGDYRTARRLYEQARDFAEQSADGDTLLLRSSLQGLAATLTELGDFREARRLHERVTVMVADKLGKDHADYAQALTELAATVEEMGDRQAAMELHAQALQIRREQLSDTHPAVAESLHHQGRLLLGIDDRTAEQLLGAALEIRESTLGAHPLVAETLGARAASLAAIGRHTDALASSMQAEEMSRNHLSLTVRTLSERQALRFASVKSSGIDVALSLIATGHEEESVGEVWDSVSRSRALILDEMAARRLWSRGTEDPEADRLMAAVAAAARRLANLTLRGPEDLDPGKYRFLLDQAADAKEEAERALARSGDAYRRDRSAGSHDLREISSALPEGTALVAYVQYDRWGFDLDVQRDTSNEAPVVSSYLAFALASGESKPAAIPLGAAAEIDRLVGRWSKEAGYGALRDDRTLAEAELACRVAGEALRERIWDPVVDVLGTKATRLFVVPAGTLHLVSLAALPVGEGDYLIKAGPVIHHVSAERDLVALAEHRITHGHGLLVMGGADFDNRGMGFPTRPEGRRESDTADKLRTSASQPDFSSVQFEALPASIREAEEIVDIWEWAEPRPAGQASDDAEPAILFTRGNATEAAFKEQAPGRRVVHLATHGFFLGSDGQAAKGTRGVTGLRPRERAEGGATVHNPLLLSGLALAGANHRASAALDQEDGIVTAEEIATLNLTGVEWAVLSACETGVGEIQVGEGVLGLKRAFQIAGAKTSIMSLWNVEDEFARAWMKELYRQRFVAGRQTSDAVHEASLALLHRAEAEHGTTHPFYWAGFVASGDWH